VRRQLDTKLAVTAGIYFTHHSNLGMTKPNPGIDSATTGSMTVSIIALSGRQFIVE
jgi:hypothetical protein